MLSSVAYILLLALLLGWLFSKLRLPAVVGMLLTGVILGPHGVNLIDSSLLSISTELRQIALVIILLRAGLSLNIGELLRVGRPAMLICFVPACLEIIGVVTFAPLLLGVSLVEAAVIGAVIAAVSPAVIVPKMLNLIDKKIGTDKSIPQMIIAGGSVDDVFVIVLFTAFLTLASGGELSILSFAQIPVSIVMGLVMGSISGFSLVAYFKRFHMRDSIKLLIMLSVAFMFLTVEGWLKDLIPISGLLAVITMGIVILHKYERLARRISPKFNKLWVAAEILLFVLVGASVDISYAASAGFAAVGLIFLALAFRMVGVFISMIKTPLNTKERLFCMIAYMPKATVQAAIGSLPLAMGLPCGNIVLTVAVLAIIITAPLGAFGIDATYNKFLHRS